MKFPFIAIEGNIGAGKTTLASAIAAHTNYKLLTERFTENPFLENFYKDKEKYALRTEMFFLEDRYQHLKDIFSVKKENIIADYSVYKSLIFSEINLNQTDLVVFKNKFDEILAEVRKPDLILFIKSDSEQVDSGIRTRGREYEMNIDLGYLKSISRAYEKFWRLNTHISVIQVNITDFRFPYEEAEIKKLIENLNSFDFSTNNILDYRYIRR